jgi:hypothetical protein
MKRLKESRLVRELKDQALFGVIITLYTTAIAIQGAKRIYYDICRIPYTRKTHKETGLYWYERK